jgi:hypothetical protein
MLGIISLIWSIIDFFRELWGKIPDPVKEQIINMIVSSFKGLFRYYYRQWKGEEE